MNTLQTPGRKIQLRPTTDYLSPWEKERATWVRTSEAQHPKKGSKNPQACPRALGRFQKGLRSPCAFSLGRSWAPCRSGFMVKCSSHKNQSAKIRRDLWCCVFSPGIHEKHEQNASSGAQPQLPHPERKATSAKTAVASSPCTEW